MNSQSEAKSPWLAVASMAIGGFATVTAEMLPVGVLPEVAEQFQISDGQAGLMITLPGILAALSAPGVMILSGKADRRRILLALSVILFLACLVSAAAPSFEILLLGRAFVGISLGAFWAMALAVAVRLVAKELAHKAAATVFAGVTAAMILGVPLGTMVATHFSWRGAFIATAIIAAVGLLAQAIALPKIRSEAPLKFGALLHYLGRPASRKSMMMIVLVFVAHFGTYTYIAPLLHRSGIDSFGITLILLVFGVAGFSSNFVAGHFLKNSPFTTLLMAKLLLLASLLALPWLSALPASEVAAIVVWGLAWGALPVCLNTWNRDVSGDDTDASTAMFTFTGQIAIALGSGLGGLIVDHLGLSSTFGLGAMVVFMSAFLLLCNRSDIHRNYASD